MRYCASCGSMNETDAKFCSGCGKKFENAPVENTPVFDNSNNSNDAESNLDNAAKGVESSVNDPKDSATINTNANYGTDYRTQNNNNAGQVKNEPAYGQQNQYNQNFAQAAPAYGEAMSINKYKGYGITSLILGICSLVFVFFIPVLPLAAAIVGLVFANKLKKYGLSGTAKAGKILCIIAIIITAILLVLFIVAVAALSSAIINNPDFYNYFTDIFRYIN